MKPNSYTSFLCIRKMYCLGKRYQEVICYSHTRKDETRSSFFNNSSGLKNNFILKSTFVLGLNSKRFHDQAASTYLTYIPIYSLYSTFQQTVTVFAYDFLCYFG